MGSIHQLSPDGARNEGAAELNCAVQEEQKEVRDGIMGDGQGMSEEDESRINEAALDMNDIPGADEESPGHQCGLMQQQQQQMPGGPIVRWEKILPVRTLKVLLVENDDSTRQVVSALLRNCSYEVTATANGLEAWKVLENLTNRIDLVLTEVVMPYLSGVGLLCKIMSHNACKNIPVIMMSSNDSMGTVFKCLSKGAVDFLVKPIRKNELKNLWQHVWRRCHSSSGSVSESGIQTQKSTKSKSADDSENNTGSSDEDDNGSIGLNARDGSDNGSGTQSSWTKHAVEVESPRPMSPSDELPDRHDSTCAQVIPKPETLCNEWVPMTANRECQEQKELSDDLMGKDLGIGAPGNLDAQHELYPTEKVSTQVQGKNMDKLPKSETKNEDLLGLQGINGDEPSTKVADLIGGIANNSDIQHMNSVSEVPNGFSRISESKDKVKDGSVELPSLQLSLKRLRSMGEVGNANQDDRNVLRRSDISAFSRYRTSAASSQAPTVYVGSCSPIDNSSEAVKTDAVKQGSNGSSNNDDMGSTTKNAFTNPAAFKEKATMPGAINSTHPSSAFHPVQLRTSAPQQVTQEKIDSTTVSTVVEQPRGAQRQFQVQHHHHHYHHHHHHVHSMQQPPPQDRDGSSRKNMGASGPHCGSSNVFTGPVEGNAANYSNNGSNSGSNNGSNGQNGKSRAVNNGGMNIENPIAENYGVGGGNGSRSGSGVDQSRFAQREAALNKFRQKRKERNFGKKVRYQSRKRLAEQRPRVKGQFVRQTVNEHASREADS